MTAPTDRDVAAGIRRLPAWRVALLGLAVVLAALFAIVALTTVSAALAPYSPLPARVHTALVGLPVVAVVYTAFRRLILRRPASFFLIRRPGVEVLLWGTVGLALPAAVVATYLLLGSISPAATVHDPASIVGFLLASVASGLLAGVLEEVAFRGYLLRLIEARWSPRVAIGATAAVFALLHQGHATSTPALALVFAAMLAAGVLLGLVAHRTRNVWNAVAVHAGWNTVFGGQVIAAAPDRAIVVYRLAGRDPFLAGGDATVAAAPLTTAILVLAAVVLARVDLPGADT